MRIKSVNPLGKFDLMITFHDNSRRIFHGRDLWKEKKRFEPLKNIMYFNTAGIHESEHTISWPFNHLEISPEWLMEWSTPV